MPIAAITGRSVYNLKLHKHRLIVTGDSMLPISTYVHDINVPEISRLFHFSRTKITTKIT